MPSSAMRLFPALLLACLALGACGGSEKPAASAGRGNGDAEPLPAPAGAAGGVTGMPDEPGPGHVGPPEPAPGIALDAEGNPILPVEEGAPGAAPVTPPVAAPEPGPAEAVALVRDYYAAINRGDFGRAHALWADGGRASRQSAEQFAAGFAETTSISVEVLPPGPVEGAADSRQIEVPVAFTANQRDGTQRRFVGAYVLRRGVVDGATPEESAWRIASADLRTVAP